MPGSVRLLAVLVALALAASACGADEPPEAEPEQPEPVEEVEFSRVEGVTTALEYANHLAGEDDRIPDMVLRACENRMPDDVHGSAEGETFVGEPDPEVFFRESGSVTVVLSDGEHDLVYHPGIEWMTRIAAAE